MVIIKVWFFIYMHKFTIRKIINVNFIELTRKEFYNSIRNFAKFYLLFILLLQII